MATIGRWNGFKFVMTKDKMLGFKDLTIKGSSETEDKESGNQSYVKRKKGKPAEVTLTVAMSAALGVNVRDEALKLVKSARAGEKDYFYIGTKKLLTCKLMLVDATVKDTAIGSGNKWNYATVQLTMKQSDKSDASSTKKSIKRSGTTKPKTTGGKKDEVDAITGAAPSVTKMQVKAQQAAKKLVSSAVQTINKITTLAKKLTQAKKTTSKPAVVKPAASRRIVR